MGFLIPVITPVPLTANVLGETWEFWLITRIHPSLPVYRPKVALDNNLRAGMHRLYKGCPAPCRAGGRSYHTRIPIAITLLSA